MKCRDKAESEWRQAFRRLSEAPVATDDLVNAEDSAYRVLDEICRSRGECLIISCRNRALANGHCRKHRASGRV